MRRDGAGELHDVNQNSLSFADFQPAAAMPSLRGSNERKGTEKLDWVSLVRCHKQIGLNCTGRKPSFPGRATTVSMVRQRSAWLKPLNIREVFRS